MKKILSLLTPLLLTFTSAYGESYGKIIGGIYMDTELIGASIIFLVFFSAILISTRKMNLFKNDVVRIVTSMAISAFAILGLNKIGLDYTKIIIGIGLERFLIQNLTWIILTLLIIASIFWKIGKTIMILGGIIFSAGILGIFNPNWVFNWELTLIIGTLIFFIGLGIKNKLQFKTQGSIKTQKGKRKRIKKLQKEFEKASNKGNHEKANQILKQIKFLEE